MNQSEIIKKLKTNTEGWSFLDPEVRRFAEKHFGECVSVGPKGSWYIAHRFDLRPGMVIRLREEFEMPKPKPERVEPVWVTYAVCKIKGVDWVVDVHEPIYPLSELDNLEESIGRFGGVQFQGQRMSGWHLDTRKFISEDGDLTTTDYLVSSPVNLASPCLARFYKQQEKTNGRN